MYMSLLLISSIAINLYMRCVFVVAVMLFFFFFFFFCFVFVVFYHYIARRTGHDFTYIIIRECHPVKIKKISNDQELIQSDPASCPQNRKGNN